MNRTAMIVIIGLVALLAVACGQQATDEAIWEDDDARAGVRDYLLSLVAIAKENESKLAFGVILMGIAEWQVEYEGNGWWVISGEDLGATIDDKVEWITAEGEWRISERTGSVVPRGLHAAMLSFMLIL